MRTMQAKDIALAVSAFEQMEGMINDVEGWGDVLMHIGSCPNSVEPRVLALLGFSVNAVGDDLRSRWSTVNERMDLIRQCLLQSG